MKARLFLFLSFLVVSLSFAQSDETFVSESSLEIIEEPSAADAGGQDYITSPTIPAGKELVENAIATAKERFLLVNSEKVNLSEPADFDRIQALVFIRNRPVLDISELEALGGARIVHLGKFRGNGVSEEETKILWKD